MSLIKSFLDEKFNKYDIVCIMLSFLRKVLLIFVLCFMPFLIKHFSVLFNILEHVSYSISFNNISCNFSSTEPNLLFSIGAF